MEIKFRRNEDDDSEKLKKTNTGIGEGEIIKPVTFEPEKDEREIIKPVTFESEKDDKEIIKPVTFESEKDDKEIIKPVTFEAEKVKGQESCSEISARKGIQAEVSEAINEPLHTPQEITSAISFYVKQVDLDNGSIEPAAINDELGGAFVLNDETMAVISAPFIQATKKKGNHLPDNLVQLARRLENSTSPIEAGDIIRGEPANYVLKPKYFTVFFTREGKEEKERRKVTFSVEIRIKGESSTENMTILSADIDKINTIVKKSCPFAILYDPSFTLAITNKFRQDLKGIPKNVCFEFAGWVKYAGRYVYLHKDSKLPGVEVATALSLPFDEQANKGDLAKTFDRATQIYWDSGVSYTLILYSLLGVLYRPFDEVGYPPHFLLFINGISGSFKTSIAKVLYIQLADDTFRNTPRRIDADSMTSLEVALTKSGQDTVTLLDDFSPAKTTQQKNERENKLEFIIRLVGDGSSKSRSNAKLEDVRGAGIKGMVAITGELRGKGFSSALRCLFVELTKDQVNLDALSWFQTNSDAFTTFIYHFTIFVSEHWEHIVNLIENRFTCYREEASKVLQAKRLVDTLSILWIATDILLTFLDEYCGYGFADIENRAAWIKKDIQAVVIHSEGLSQEDDPAKTFMEALDFLVNHGKILICPPGEGAEDLLDWDGFVAKGFVFLQPELVYQKVRQHLENNGHKLTLDAGEIFTLLCQAGYAETASNGKNKKTWFFRRTVDNGVRAKFVKIRVEVFQHLDDDDSADQ